MAHFFIPFSSTRLKSTSVRTRIPRYSVEIIDIPLYVPLIILDTGYVLHTPVDLSQSSILLNEWGSLVATFQ